MAALIQFASHALDAPGPVAAPSLRLRLLAQLDRGFVPPLLFQQGARLQVAQMGREQFARALLPQRPGGLRSQLAAKIRSTASANVPFPRLCRRII
jgi:hypothetical protein